jgi:selenocysteine lyase/cysteine desulfurase
MPPTQATLPPPQDLIAHADHFPILQNWHFFNHGGVCPLPRVAADALNSYTTAASTHAYLHADWYRRISRLRSTAASLIGASRSEIALVKNTSQGLSFVANGLTWHPGDRIVLPACEYPSNQYPWMDLARHGVEVVKVPEVIGPDGVARVPTASILAAADHPRTRLLTISHVQYASGHRADLHTLGQFCRSRNILFNVDAIQSWGVLPLNVQEMNIDFASADGHKWLLGPEGAGLLYVRQSLQDQLRPTELGWLSVVDDQNYSNIDLTLKPTAGRYECGTLNIPGFLALAASVDLLTHVSTPFISQRLATLTSLSTHLAQQGSPAKQGGWTVVSPSPDLHPHEWSGATCLTHPQLSEQDLKQIALALRTHHQIETAVRGQRLRLTPHFYTPEAHIEQLFHILRTLTP